VPFSVASTPEFSSRDLQCYCISSITWQP